MNKKKGIALNQSFGAVLALILVAMLVIIAIFMFVNLGATFVNIDSFTVINESITPTGTPIKVAQAITCNFGRFVVTNVFNSTTNEVISPGNYTTTALGTINNLTVEYKLNPWLVTYTFTTGGEACNSTDTMIAQFGTYPALVGLVGTIIFLGLVIGVLVASFTFGRREV